MSSHLVPMNSDIFDQWVRDAAAVQRIVRVRSGSPWQGLIPDLDPNQSSPSGMVADSHGLVARPGPDGIGEVLMPDAGFTQLDGANLPLSTAGGYTANTMLAQFDRTTAGGAKTSGSEYDGPTLLALIGGNDLTAGDTELWRAKPSDGTWEQVPWSQKAGGAGVGITAGHEPAATRNFLSDWAVFPAGAPSRSEYSGAISEPVFVWCNLHDRVMVYPVDDGVVTGIEDGAFEPLTYDLDPTFKAATVESFGGRLYFGNTIEGSTQYRQRIRRTALFTADPQVSVGSGAFDIRDFSGDLLRLEKLGSQMVAYFEDGTAFIHQSGVATAPDRVQLLRDKRGLLGTHAVTSVGANEHFGIFDDGWFFLDTAGRWTEVGMLNIEGKQVPMWKDTFYNLLDMNFRDRTVISYDGRFVRIAFTTHQASDPENQEVSIFDPRGNRVFRELYPVVCWGISNVQIRTAGTWDVPGGDLTTATTWAEVSGSWDTYAAKFGIKALHHGTTDGHVLKHDYDIITKYDTAKSQNAEPTFHWQGKLISGGDPTKFKQAIKLWVEHIYTGTGGVTFKVEGDSADSFESGSVDFSTTGSLGDIQTTFRTFNFKAANLQFSIAGSAPIQIRSILTDIAIEETEERLG